MIVEEKLKPDGSLFTLYLAFYAPGDWALIFCATAHRFLFGLHQAQVISIIVLAITVPWMIKNTRLVKKDMPIPPNSDKIEPVRPA